MSLTSGKYKYTCTFVSSVNVKVFLNPFSSLITENVGEYTKLVLLSYDILASMLEIDIVYVPAGKSM